MSYLDKYQTRNSMYGNGVRDIRIDNTKRKISSIFTDSPSYHEVSINSSTTPTGVWLVDNSDNKDTKDIYSQTDYPIHVGDLIDWNGHKWLITIRDDMTEVYYKGIANKCLAPLKWLNDEGIEKSTWFTYRSETLSNYGINFNPIVDSGNERRHIWLPSNADTLKFVKKTRFIVDNRAWIVSSIDRLKEGIVYLVITESEIIAADNLDEGIADYYGSVANFGITILNGETFSIRANQTLQLFAEVKNRGVVVDKSIVWSTSNASIATVDQSGILSAHANGTVTVTAILTDDNTVFDTATVVAQFTVVDNYSIELNSTLDVLIGTSKTFTATVKNNLVVDPTRFVQFTFTDGDGISQPSAGTVTFSSSTQFTLMGNSSGIVLAKAHLVGSSPSIDQVFSISVKGLL
jgi:uncharacterized protein YjdB